MQNRNVWFLILVLVVTVLSVVGYQNTKLVKGLDVAGGIRLVYSMDTSELTPEQLEQKSEIQSRLRSILEGRVGTALGVVEGAVTTKGDDQFIVEMPGATNIEEARRVLQNTAKIQVFHARNVSTERRSRIFVEAGEGEDEFGPYIEFARASDSARTIRPGDPQYARMIEGWRLLLEGEDVVDAGIQVTGNNMAQPTFRFGGEGARNLERWSRQNLNQGEKIAFVLDGRVLSIAPVQDGAILSDTAFIDGEFDPAYVNTLTSLIKSGSLPVPLREEASQLVSPTIGETAFNQMVTAGAISLGIICAYLIFYYSFPGVIAAVAMVLYALLTLTVLKLMGATFSLASVAAFILSAGMAVDANILVFERIKEELRAGRKLATAIELGFRRALSAIVDSNLCTVITSLVLFVLGTGPVKGFATTLIVGVLVSFFTAVAVTRSLLVGLTSVGIGNDEKWFGLNRSWFGEKLEHQADSKALPIIGRARTWFLVSAVLIVPGLIAAAAGGIRPNVEFQGGYEAQYVVDAGTSADAIRARLTDAGYRGFNLKFAEVGTIRTVYITIPRGGPIGTSDPEALQRIARDAGLNPENGSITEIGATVQRETTQNAILGVLIASSLIVLYLAVRFGFALGGLKNGLKFGLSAVAALIHDVAFVIGSAAIVGFTIGWEISALFITAMLTVIGFSVHDTIIIFDRIRENLRRSKGSVSFRDLIDRSVTQTIARSINTSFTAILPLAALLAFGTPTPELKFMCLAMLLGITIGTYSSIFNASAILYFWDKMVIQKRGESHGLVAEAQAESKLRAATVLDQAATASAAQTANVAGDASYGTIRRRKSAQQSAAQVLDEDEK